MQQHGSKYFACRRPTNPPTLGLGSIGQNSTFSQHGHVAYQIKWNHECRNMVANILPADLPPTILGIKRSKFNFFRSISNLRDSRMQQHDSKYFAPSPTPPDPGGWGQKVSIQLFQNMVMLHIRLKGITNAATW